MTQILALQWEELALEQDGLCWESLSDGDAAAFDRQAAIGADLRLFGACARLMDDE